MKIVVIGAGVAGLAIGWRLLQAGQEVWVLERAQPGHGATWASAGMLAVTAELLHAGTAELEFAHYANDLWPAFARKIEAASGLGLGYSEAGALLLAEDPIRLDQLARAVRPGVALVDVARVRDIAPLVTGEIAGGLWSQKEALVNNRALARALAVAFQKAGGTIRSNETAVKIERDQDRAVAARTPFALYYADAFVLAAGAWSGLVEQELAPIVPIKGQIVFLVPPPGVAVPSCVLWGHGVYLVPRGRGLMIGATAEEAGFDTMVTEEARASLMSQAARLIPDLRQWKVEDQWAGLRPKGPDGLALLGKTALEGLWLASGQYRNGILFAPAVAETMARQILGEAGPIPAFDPRRFEA